MCAGRSKRFGTHKPKCLAEVQGQPNLKRTLEKLWFIGYSDITVTVPHDKEYYFHFITDKVNFIKGQNTYETQRFSNAFPLNETTVYLYGDVVYDLSDLLTILEPREVTTWYGKMNAKRELKSCDELMAVQVIDTKKFEQSVYQVESEFKSSKRKQVKGNKQ